ncbi:recombinase XerC [Ureibacillus massiliensis 4400831 = CIP 108448 = CCUG 49529]|uniref:Recombinase XerC n=1 Tax=Ureibacillus massiliensis 4400831 = CIP 108448 = CCUG 49529 TaxID=1211035 RepID=A0A0A3JT28_9BACL|nr:tyrosine-type recombinase/integrase [Ureibacillus massiliensis]KGR90177.1 recombinase XerC [Ureibacillus massiliensis 4400831 = CIP 108448 = CCUG 49529]
MQYLNGFEHYLRGKDKSDNTISCYLRDMKQFIGWYSTKTEHGINKIIELDAVEYKKHLQKGQQAIITINRKLASLNVFLHWMKEAGHIKEEISVKPIKNREVITYKGLEQQDIWKLRKEIHRQGNLMHICIIELLLQTGIRVSELVNIRLTDIEITERKGTLAVIGKGNVKRTLPLNKDVRKAIERYLPERPEADTDHLLIGQRGALQRNAINLILSHYGDRLNIKVTPHMIRHTLGHTLVKQQVEITTIQQIFGHSNIQTTNIYTVTTDKEMEQALESVEW